MSQYDPVYSLSVYISTRLIPSAKHILSLKFLYFQIISPLVVRIPYPVSESINTRELRYMIQINYQIY